MFDQYKFDGLRIGVGIHDMHYGRPDFSKIIVEPVVVLEEAHVDMAGGGDLIQSAITKHYPKTWYMYCNKMLVVVQDCAYHHTGGRVIQLAYSYDNTRFGLYVIGLKDKKSYTD